MNVFQSSFDARLRGWYDLRNDIADSGIQEQVLAIDEWWQKAPFVNHYLHPHDIDEWPGPWVLLSENTYCYIAKALGMCYTLLLLGVDDLELVIATDDSNEEHCLVLVNGAKYVMNYYPNTVLNNSLTDFTVKQRLDIETLKQNLK